MTPITVLGLLAAVFTTTAFIPQALKTIQTRNTKDLSLGMYIILTLGVMGWLAYGILIHNLPLIIANSITLIFTLIILVYKIIYK